MSCHRCCRPTQAKSSFLSSASQRTFRTSAIFRQSQASPTEGQSDENAPASTESSLHILKVKCNDRASLPNRERPAQPANITKHLGTRYSRPPIGGMEWQTSAYHYNKQTSKSFPVVAKTTDNLLTAYSVLEPQHKGKSSKSALAQRRKSEEKLYVSHTTAKDYGGKIVIDAFVYDGTESNSRAKGGPKTGGRRRPAGKPDAS